MQDSFRTIAERQQAELKIQRSRFIATVMPVSSRDEAENEYQAVRRQFHDATHNCFAYLVGVEPDIESRYSDDGEPSGTAGRPIFDAIQTAELSNALIVVTRYYGGIKLGTGGLGRAYRDSARLVLDQANVVERLIKQTLRIIFAHPDTSIVMRILSEHQLPPLATRYSENVEIDCAVRLSRLEALRHDLVDRSQGRVSVEEV